MQTGSYEKPIPNERAIVRSLVPSYCLGPIGRQWNDYRSLRHLVKGLSRLLSIILLPPIWGIFGLCAVFFIANSMPRMRLDGPREERPLGLRDLLRAGQVPLVLPLGRLLARRLQYPWLGTHYLSPLCSR